MANFNTEGKQAITTWQIADLEAGDGYGSFEFFFRAGLKVGENLAESDKLLVPINSATGCVNCNVGAIPPSVCQCYDGTNIERGFNQSCKTICQAHIGDAHNPPGSDGGGGGNGGVGSGGGQPLHFNFKLKNYLIGDPKDIGGVLGLLGRFIFNLGIPLAVIVIIYGGLRMLTSGGSPNQYKKGLEALKWATIGLAVLLIGKGFVSLVQSILSIK